MVKLASAFGAGVLAGGLFAATLFHQWYVRLQADFFECQEARAAEARE